MSYSFGPLHVIKQTSNVCKNSVIILHGSGDTGHGFLEWMKFVIGDFSHPHISFYFPTAPLRRYTPLGGELSNVWFDRFNISPDVPEHKESLESAGVEITKLINQIEQSGVPREKIFVGGFSMGGSLALHTAYRFCPGLNGVFSLSSFLNDHSKLYRDIKSWNTPLYMCHGDKDTLVPLSWGQNTFEELTKIGLKGEFVTIKNMMHEIKKEELLGLLEWIKQKASLESQI